MKKLGNLLGVAACGALLACASAGDGSRTPSAVATVAAPETTQTGPDTGVRLSGVTVVGNDEQTVVQLAARGSLSIYSSYNPEPSLVVVDIPNGEFDPELTSNLPADPRIKSVRVSRLTEFGRPFARIELRTSDGAHSEVERSGEQIAIRLTGKIDPIGEKASGTSVAEATLGSESAEGTLSAAAEPKVISEPLPAESVALVPQVAPEEPAGAENSAAAVPAAVAASIALPANAGSRPATLTTPSGKAARRLERVRSIQNGASTVVEFTGDGQFAINDFYLENPSRLVFDLDGVTNSFAKKSIDVSHNGIGRVRISQFQLTPKPICRVVLDLDGRIPYKLEATKNGTRLIFDAARSVAPVEPEVLTQQGEGSKPTADTAHADKKAESPEAEKTASVVEERASPAVEATIAPVAVAATQENSRQTQPEPVAVAASSEKPLETRPLAAEPSKTVAVAASVPATAPRGAKSAPKPTVEESALFEAAEAYLADAKDPEISGGKFEPKTLPKTDQAYVGEPISLHLKDNDIRDVLRTISQLTGLNIVIDPEVGGKVTIDLEEVPWDQALELILKVNGLNYQLDGNVMRIGRTSRLQQEEADKRKLEEEKELSQPQESYIYTLSYAKAEALQPLIQRVMSKRGDVIVDPRTNKLIIKDIHAYLQKAINLVEKLDIANQQVVIEARIVETTKNFSRQLGISWGFLGQADAAHGNATNWKFPYDGTISGGVGLGVASLGPAGGGPLLAMSLGSILDTFNLDAALSAAEAEGLAKVVSSPKVTTESNFQAKIQSGVQIPVQTSANNTTTVTYIDATLSLDVKPQITAQQTVIMDIKVAKRSPLTGLTVAGGTNVPLSTREASTRLLVKDGGTAVIGGIYEITDNNAESRVPGLGSIPIIGNLFKNNQKQKKHDELLIFITPRIVKG